MSLKAFHILFITASTLLTLGFGAWSMRNFFALGGAPSDLVLGLGSSLVGFALIGYGRYFLRKLKGVGYV